MITSTLVETQAVGELTRVTVRLTSEKVHSINEQAVSELDYDSAYHKSLHENRVTHRHNQMIQTVVVYLDGEFSQEKLDKALEESIAKMESIAIEEFTPDSSAVQERMFVDGSAEKTFYKTDLCPPEILQQLVEAFPDQDISKISLISTPSFHSILGEDVISTFLWEDDVPNLVIDGVRLITRSRKFCMRSKKKYDRCYTFCEESFPFIPSGCTLLAKSFHTNIDSGLVLPDFFDVYFSGDAAVVEAAFNLPHRVGKQSTYYAVTVLNGTVLRAKQYVYDTPTAFHDWSGVVRRATQSFSKVDSV